MRKINKYMIPARGPQTFIFIISSNSPYSHSSKVFISPNIPAFKITTSNFSTPSSKLINSLRANKISHIILAGYLRLIPNKIIKEFPNKILNIHPALLPKFGGKGYYGDYVHKSVIDSKEKKSGITIHLVNEKYDDGRILFQKSIAVMSDDDVASLSSRIHQLEYKYYPQIIEKYLLNQL